MTDAPSARSRRSGRSGRRVRPLVDAVQASQPKLLDAVTADVRMARAQRGEPVPDSTPGVVAAAMALAWRTDAFEALFWYRVQASSGRRGIPILPTLAHRRSMARSGVVIGTPVRIEPGVLLPHGHVVIDGLTRIGTGARIRPFVTIGLREGDITGPTIGDDVKIGTGATVIGPVTIGDGATIGAGAVVVDDVPAGAVVVGAPARAVGTRGIDAAAAATDAAADGPADVDDPGAPVDVR